MSQCNRRGHTAQPTAVVLFRNPVTHEEWTSCVCEECAEAANAIFQQVIADWRTLLDTPPVVLKKEE